MGAFGGGAFAAGGAVPDPLTLTGRVTAAGFTTSGTILNTGTTETLNIGASGQAFAAGYYKELFIGLNNIGYSAGLFFFQGTSPSTLALRGYRDPADTQTDVVLTAVRSSRTAGKLVEIGKDSGATVVASWDYAGKHVLAPTVETAGSPTAWTYTGAAHTTLALAETIDCLFNAARTVNFAATDGTIAAQRAVKFMAPTYSGGATPAGLTLTEAATVYIDREPQVSGNTAVTRPYSLWIDAGIPRIDSSVAISTGTVTASNVAPTGMTATVGIWLYIDIAGSKFLVPGYAYAP